VWDLDNDRTNRLAAESLYCAGETGKFWEMHDWLYYNVDTWSSADDIVTVLSEVAAPEVGVDGAGLANCLQEERYRAQLEAFMDDAQQRGIQSTPSFLVGGQPIVGAYPFETFREVIEEALQP
jgi:protein-disulfide isomerase